MENLPDSLDVDPREDVSSSSSSSSSRRPFSAAVLREIEQYIRLINWSQTRAPAITHLNKVYKTYKELGNAKMGLLLWNSGGVPYVLLEELTSAYTMLSPSKLDNEETKRVCDTLGLLQCIASQPEARMGFIRAQMPIYVYPFLNTTEKQPVQFDYLRINSLGVIGMLVKDESPINTEIVHFLLESEIVPFCLRCMDMGGEVTKSIAALVIGKILEQQEGKRYIGFFIERFVAVSKALSKIVTEFSGKPLPDLVKNILICYSYLTKLCRCCDSLKDLYPQRLRNPAYLNFICDAFTRPAAERLLYSITATGHVQPATEENQFSRMLL